MSAFACEEHREGGLISRGGKGPERDAEAFHGGRRGARCDSLERDVG
jgi:hypothetical protein